MVNEKDYPLRPPTQVHVLFVGTFQNPRKTPPTRGLVAVVIHALFGASYSIGLSGALHRVKSLGGFCWHNPIIGPVIWIAGNLIWWGGLIVLSGYIGAKLFEAMEHTSFVRGLTNLIEIRTNPGRANQQ